MEKINNLAEGLTEAAGEIILCSDSDCLLQPQQLRVMMRYLLSSPHIGAVCCGYDCKGIKGMGSILDAITYTQTCLLRWNIFGRPFFLGDCMAIKRHLLERIGGFNSIRNYITEDLILAQKLKEIGYRAIFIHLPVMVTVGVESFHSWFSRLHRHILSLRLISPFSGVVMTSGIILLSFGYLILSLINFTKPSDINLAMSLFIICLFLRISPMTLYNMKFLNAGMGRYFLLFPITDLIYAVV